MVKNILLLLLGLFVLLLIMGTLFIKRVAGNEEFAELKGPPTVLAEPIANPFGTIYAVSIADKDTIELNPGSGLAFINFWATWCRPCISEMPTIEKLFQAYKGKMAFYIISTDKSESKIRGFMKNRGYEFPVYRLIKTPKTDSLARKLPLTLLSYNSELHIYHSGSANWNSRAVHQLIEELSELSEGQKATNGS
ncbi:MAG: redoxin domain-containing protein [Lewinellaceae bacterium]|nr:redoxin domain-containing protein [Lewinellaceae bacterium]MCB9291049.1 redoxin domain-containing protein [Lewinellaceae bacterium]